MAYGMFNTELTVGSRSLKSRRKIFHSYPTGAAPLMGLLSFLPEEETDKVEFGWFEQRFPAQRTKTVASGTAPFRNAADSAAIADGGDLTADTVYTLVVVSTAEFKPTHVIEIRKVTLTGGTTSVKGTVTEIVSATKMKFRPYSTATAVDNAATDNNGKTVAIIGTANQEGGRSGQGIYYAPINPTNLTQIFRTAFSITRTALKGGLEYDSSGPYKLKAKQNGLRHMIEMEKAFLFGQRHTVLVADPDTGEQLPETKTGGVTWFLEQWEAANSIYRGGTGAAAVTSNDDENKRIINVDGELSKANYNKWIGRLFKHTSDKAYEKLCLCGGTFLEAINTLFENQVERTVMIGSKDRTWEFQVHSHVTLRGTVHYKVHPLFDEDPDLQGNGMFLDLGDLMYRPLTDSDTTFLKGRQETDRDARKDEWITEAGLELKFPEGHMYWTGVTGAAA